MEKEKFKRPIAVRVIGVKNSLGRPDNSLRYSLTRRDFGSQNLPNNIRQTAQIKSTVSEQNQIYSQTEQNISHLQQIEPGHAEQANERSLIDLSLPGGVSDFKSTYKYRRPIIPALKTWSFRFASVAMVLILLGGGLFFAQSYMTLHKVLRGGSKTIAALQTNVNPNQLKGEGDGRINILLMGRGGGKHDGPDLTDTMMLASIDPVNSKVTLISIPRDLWIDVPNQGAMKLMRPGKPVSLNIYIKLLQEAPIQMP
jgi:hypothetical protein